MKSLAAENASAAELPDAVTAAEQLLPDQADALARARAFALPFLKGETLDTGENALAHADAVAAILKDMGGSETMQAASYLVYACPHLTKPEEIIAQAFGENFARLAVETTRIVKIQQRSRDATVSASEADIKQQTENVRKMLVAFSRDMRVVLLRLASRLQTLRHHAAQKTACPSGVARESLQVFAPLANRLGIWRVKWEMEDLAFRFLEPQAYKDIAHRLDSKRIEREQDVERWRHDLERDLKSQGIKATVMGRPKHIYSIAKKMRGKHLDFDQVLDVRALRVIVPEVKDCYAVLSRVHEQFTPEVEFFDDYIAKPKANGYQSLHTIVRDAQGRPAEIQIRTQEMHQHAEHGVSAHWVYKEAGTKGYAGVTSNSQYDAKIAVLRQLLAWERDISGAVEHQGLFDDRIYVLTPDAVIVELPQGATAVDFAYSIHTSVGHRCRGAKVDGAMVALNTPLHNGQTVEVTVAKEGGPSLDWLNPELHYLTSHRARAKVRAWFNAQAAEETVARGREAVEKLLQREGKTAIKLEDLAAQLGFDNAEALFAVVGKEEFSLHTIEALLRPPEAPPEPDEQLRALTPPDAEKPPKGGVLVVGMDSLLTQLAKCCRPAPGDDIAGFVTRGKGVSVHRADCSNFREMAGKSGGRVIEVAWGKPKGEGHAVYPVDVAIEAADRQGLLRDISEVFAKEKMNVVGVQTQSLKGTARMTFTVEVAGSARLAAVLGIVREVVGVRWARRR